MSSLASVLIGLSVTIWLLVLPSPPTIPVTQAGPQPERGYEFADDFESQGTDPNDRPPVTIDVFAEEVPEDEKLAIKAREERERQRKLREDKRQQKLRDESYARAQSYAKSISFQGKIVELPMPAVRAALDESTGDIVITGSDKPALMLRSAWFDGTAPVEQIDVSAFPANKLPGVQFKRLKDQTLLVTFEAKLLGTAPHGVVRLLDAKTLEPIDPETTGLRQQFPVFGREIYTSKNPKDLSIFTDNGRFFLDRPLSDPPSASYQRRIHGVSESGRIVQDTFALHLQAPPGFPKGRAWKDADERDGVLDPLDQYYHYGYPIFGEGKKERIDSLAEVQFFFPDRDLVLLKYGRFKDNRRLRLIRRDGEYIHETWMRMPSDFGLNPQGNIYPYKTLLDRLHQRVVVIAGDEAALIPFSALPDDTEIPSITLDDLPTYIEPRKELSVDVSSHRKGTEVTLTEKPDGVQFLDHKLKWTPTPDQIGIHRLTFQLKLGEKESEQSYDIVVSERGLSLPFDCHRFFLSKDGGEAIVVSLGATTRFAIINTKTRETTVSEPFPWEAKQPRILRDEDQLFVVDNEFIVHTIDAKTLKETHRVAIPLDPSLTEFEREQLRWSVEANCLTGSMNQNTLRFVLPDLQTLTPPTGLGIDNQPLRVINNGRFSIGPAVLDEFSQKVDYLLEIPGAVPLVPRAPTGLETQWRMRNNSRQKKLVFRGEETQSGDVIVHMESDGQPPLARKITHLTASKKIRYSTNFVQCIYEAGTLGVTCRGVFFLFRPAEMGWLKEMPSTSAEPIKVTPRDPPLVITPTGKTKVTYSLSGGQDPACAMRLYTGTTKPPETPAIKPLPNPGDFEVDGSALVKMILSNRTAIDALKRKISMQGARLTPRDIELFAKNYRDEIRLSLGEHFQPKLSGIPISVTFQVVAGSREDNQMIFHAMLVDVPTKMLFAPLSTNSQQQR
ncbi:hypothetical protein [Stieleria varia]|uniref:hypothetical protein n=1 Tax=Stieleria varia TaxID=2528005 RepID=UPI001E32A794|nr:hypothetical protein [Stieleria varia]